VAANAGGIPSMIQDGQTGYLVDETSEYVDRINELRTCAEKRNQMGSLARQATQEWSWDASMSRLLNEQYPKAQVNFKNRWSVRLWRKLFG
jgi:glycosyltransferase involved in cell wall biosynthesis